MSALDEIRKQVMWNRLIAVVEEQAQTMIRTAFSTTVREAGDLSAGVFDREGNMLAQAVTGTPGHVNSMAVAVGHFLERHPVARMRAGSNRRTGAAPSNSARRSRKVSASFTAADWAPKTITIPAVNDTLARLRVMSPNWAVSEME